MHVFLATDHAGFALKEAVRRFLQEHFEDITVEDCGATAFDPDDDYPPIIAKAAKKLQQIPGARAIIFGGSGQGEAMVANRFAGVRAAVFYGFGDRLQVDAEGQELDIVTSVRMHNDANVLSIGARFVSEPEAFEAVRRFLETPFSGHPRHRRRIEAIDHVN